jgi:hypothetical protein
LGSDTLPVCHVSSSRLRVIRYPDSVKNSDTPRNPPGMNDRSRWNITTAVTAMARSASRPGR